MRNLAISLAIALVLAHAPAPCAAQATGGKDRLVATSEAFLGAHPDLRYRLEGLDAVAAGRASEAVNLFRRAARYADKPSQSMLGEMHWTGAGVPADRVMGYVWMDVAAERGYPLLVAKRESYWSQLTPEQRLQVREIGIPVMDEYGDAAAKPRLEKLLDRGKRGVTGSRLGFVGALVIRIPTPTGYQEVRGNEYYADKFWEPEAYFRWQDQEWLQPEGKVDVGEVQAPPPSDSPDRD